MKLRSSTRTSKICLKGPYSVSVFYSHIFFYIFLKYNEWVVVLFHTAIWTLDRLLVPLNYTLKMKNMFTL